MHRTLLSLAAAVFLAHTGFVQAQTAAPGAAQAAPPGQPAKPAAAGKRFDCSQAKDPARCEEKRKELRARVEAAKQACAAKPAEERRACLTEALCAKAPDPQKCHARAQQRAERWQKWRQACADKQGGELRACLREQRRNASPAGGQAPKR